MFSQEDIEEHFTLEKNLEQLYTCLDRVELSLCGLRGRKKGLKKKHKPGFNEASKVRAFQRGILRIGDQWSCAIDEVFNLMSDMTMYEKLAEQFISTLRKTSENYIVREEESQFVVDCLIKPVIGSIMDDREITKESKERQERRKYFLKRLLSVEINKDSPLSDEILVDVCSNSDENMTELDSAIRNTRISHEHIPGFSFESIQIADLLLDALKRHTDVVKDENLNIPAQIYHIINISHVTAVLKDYFGELKSALISTTTQSYIPLDPPVLTARKLAVEQFERKVSGCLESLEADNPMTLFRADLRNLWIKIRTLKPLVIK